MDVLRGERLWDEKLTILEEEGRVQSNSHGLRRYQSSSLLFAYYPINYPPSGCLFHPTVR
jgi:hypothetical protein